jgi:hypothetical protein
MTTGLKPIETKYKGYRFRSRLEARWAVFFDALGVPYEYEKEGFDLGKTGWYLPDFWLPGLGYWVEIKGVYPSDVEKVRCGALADATGKTVHLFWGAVRRDGYYFEELGGEGIPPGYVRTCGAMTFLPSYSDVHGWTKGLWVGGYQEGAHWQLCGHCNRAHIDIANGLSGIYEDGNCTCSYQDISDFEYARARNRLARAYEVAAAARFEHGESPQ